MHQLFADMIKQETRFSPILASGEKTMTAYYSQCTDCGWKAIAATSELLRDEQKAHEFGTPPLGAWGHQTTSGKETGDMPITLEVLPWRLYTQNDTEMF